MGQFFCRTFVLVQVRALSRCGLALCPSAALIVAVLLLSAPAFGQSYKLSEEKRQFVVRLSKKICWIANRNDDFYQIQKFLKDNSEHHFGEEITIEEAYPYVSCDKPFASNIDLLRVPVEKPGLDLFVVDFTSHFVEDVSDQTLLGKIVSCRRDFGYGCLDVFEHIEKNRRKHSDIPTLDNKYGLFDWTLSQGLAKLGGPIRDPKFCREVLDEPRHCQGHEAWRDSLKTIREARRQRYEAQMYLDEVKRPYYAENAAFAEVFGWSYDAVMTSVYAKAADGEPLPTQTAIVQFCEKFARLPLETCETRYKEFETRWQEYKRQKGSGTLISRAEAEIRRLDTRLRELCRNEVVPDHIRIGRC